MNLVKILSILVLVIFPFGELARFSVGNDIVIKPLDVFVGITAIVFVFSKRDKFVFDTISKSILLFSGSCLLSLGINSDWLAQSEFLASFLYLVRWVSYGSLYLIVASFDQTFKKKIQTILLIDGLVIVLLGYVQLFFYPSLKGLYSFGWDDHMYRMFSVFLDPNFAGAFFVLYFLFIAGLITRSSRTNKLYWIILGLTLGAILLTFSRSALLMLIVSVTVYLFLIQKRKLLFLFFGIILLFVIGISQKFYIENINLFREASSHARLDNYQAAFTIITDRPIFGIGFNTYRYAKNLYGIPSEWVSTPSHADAGVDNSFLFILATTGVVGFLIYCSLWFHILRKSWLSFYERKDIFGAVVFSSSIGLCINALFINSLFFPAILLWLWILIGLMKD